MRKVDPSCRYDEDLNSWARQDREICTIGMTDWAQAYMGTAVAMSIEVTVGQWVQVGAIFAIVESNKATSEVLSPITGRLNSINETIIKNPGLINDDCYGKGWIIKISQVEQHSYSVLHDAAWYEHTIGSFFRKGN